jgi:hypothetical protein
MAEKVNHPPHYNTYPVETIDMMISIFGRDKVRDFCLINAFKYRMRIGMKGDASEDLAKENWYLTKYRELNFCNESETMATARPNASERGITPGRHGQPPAFLTEQP